VTSDTEVWVSGYNSSYRLSGMTWTYYGAGTTGTPIWGNTASNAWMFQGEAVLHWNGSSWLAYW